MSKTVDEFLTKFTEGKKEIDWKDCSKKLPLQRSAIWCRKRWN